MRHSLSLSISLLAAVSVSAQSTSVTTAAFGTSAFCYDQGRQRLVFATPARELWEHDGLHWRQSRVTLPTATMRSVYDASRQRVFFVSGTELVAYDGHGLVAHGPVPSFQRFVADTQRARLVGIGSLNLTVTLHEWDGTTWQPGPSLGTSRITMSVAYDETRHVTVVQVLRLSPPPLAYELWEWDGASWTLAGTSPTNHGLLAYDSVRQQIIAVGPQTWSWDGTNWNVLANTPPAPTSGLLAADPGHGRVWLYNGTNLSLRYVWSWDGSSWSQSLETPHPDVSAANFTYDSWRDRAVLFSGANAAAAPHREWDGRLWHDVATAGAPSPRLRPAQAFDPVRGETIVFGGSGAPSDTWAWNGTAWRLAATSGPSPRSQAAVAFDTARGRLVLVGGALAPTGAAADHWEWDGQVWTQVAAVTPIGQVLGTLGYDPVRARLVLADGLTRTWEHAGVAWFLVATGTPGVNEGSRTLAWHATRQRLQGNLFDGTATRRFEWDGTAWTPLFDSRGELAYDSRRDVMLSYNAATLLTTTAQPASAADFGTPCGGLTTATSLTSFGRPVPGDDSFHLDVRAEAALRPALIGFSLTAGNVPLGNGCTLLLQNSIGSLLWFTDAHGFWHQPLALPNDLALRGVSLVAQAAVLDPASPGSLALSQGLTLVVGD